MNDDKTTVLPNKRQYDDSIIRPSGPSGSTIGLGIVIAIFGVMVLLFSIDEVLNAIWKMFCGGSGLGWAIMVGGFGVFLIAVAGTWALAKVMRDRKDDESDDTDDANNADDSADSTDSTDFANSTERTEEIRTSDFSDFEK